MQPAAVTFEKGLPLSQWNFDLQDPASGVRPLNKSHDSNFFSSAYANQLIGDLDFLVADDLERQQIKKSISELSEGKVRAVVTGQQPGVAGGPLYTLFKIFTTVALAKLHSHEGQPTVPVFWMGDDDDDWQELLEPLLWDRKTGSLIASSLNSGNRNTRQDMIGSLPVSPMEDATLQVLEQLNPGHDLGTSLLKLYKTSRSNAEDLSLLTERILRLVFKGTGLVIIRGNDPRLHSHCENFYTRALKHLPELARLTRERGAELHVKSKIVPLSTNSLNRPLYVSEGNGRKPWDGTPVVDFSRWRCGVLLRSMLQDWILAPSAVVVGPGELSYLSQLVPAYKHMGITRSPLVPRLFGWIVPENLPIEEINRFTFDKPIDTDRAHELALMAGKAGEEELVKILANELGLSTVRAHELAAGRTRRWVKGVQALLKNESQKQYKLNQPSEPLWVFPRQQRQERKLAWIPVAASLGWPLIKSINQACDEHLHGGARGRWSEFVFRINESDREKG